MFSKNNDGFNPLLNDIYYKVTNHEEFHDGIKYKNGLNFLNREFQEKGTRVPGGLYFTTLKNIGLYMTDGYNIRIVLIPNLPQVKIVRDRNKYRSNMVILGKKYSLIDKNTYDIFSLEHRDIPISICKYAVEQEALEFLLWIKTKWRWDLYLCDYIAEQGNLKLLMWARNNNYLIGLSVINTAAKYGHLNILRWFKKNNFEISSDASKFATIAGKIQILQWLHKYKYPFNSEICAIAYLSDQLHILEWLISIGYSCGFYIHEISNR